MHEYGLSFYFRANSVVKLSTEDEFAIDMLVVKWYTIIFCVLKES